MRQYKLLRSGLRKIFPSNYLYYCLSLLVNRFTFKHFVCYIGGMKLVLIDKKQLTKDVFTFVFKSEKELSWQAGQYLIYNLEHKNPDLKGKMRFFTISSSPFEKNPAITTRIAKNKSSSFKKTLLNMKIGSEIDAKDPDGDFVIDGLKKDCVFIAGGIGITPFYSILRQIDHKPPTIRHKPRAITLLYSGHDDNIVFKQELDEIAARNSWLKIYYLTHLEKIDKDLLKGIFFVSGPDPMVESIAEMLNNLGVKKENIKEDYFSGYKKI